VTISSAGYPGTFTAPPSRWAMMQQGLGVRYWVRSAASLLATPLQAGTRQLSLAPGDFGGHGVVDSSTGETVQLPVVATGTRYFLIVARRTWGAANATTIEVIDAGTTITALPARNANPGTIDDQPLWLVPMSAGSSVPGTPIDLRLIGTDKGVFQANSDLVRQYANFEGIEIVIGTTRWRRGSGSSGSAEWVGYGLGPNDKQVLPVLTGAQVIGAPAAGSWTWTATTPTTLRTRAVRQGNRVDVWLQMRLALGGTAIIPTQAGNFPDEAIGKLAASIRPATETPFAFLYRGGTGATNTAIVGGTGEVRPSGDVVLMSGSGLYRLNPEGSLYSLKAHFSFLQES
jgi:hypothetical protein